MAEGFHLQIITPDENFYEGEASMVELTTTEGEIGIYKGHIPLTAIISPGNSSNPIQKEKFGKQL